MAIKNFRLNINRQTLPKGDTSQPPAKFRKDKDKKKETPSREKK
jgi:hypothetical protein